MFINIILLAACCSIKAVVTLDNCKVLNVYNAVFVEVNNILEVGVCIGSEASENSDEVVEVNLAVAVFCVEAALDIAVAVFKAFENTCKLFSKYFSK